MKRLRVHLLQILFPVAVGWGLALTFAQQVDPLGALAVGPEEHPMHGVLETYLPLIIVVLACAVVAIPLYRRWPGALRVPERMPWPRFLIRLVVCTVVMFPLLMVLAGLVGIVLDSPRPDPDNPQDIPLWVFTATFYPYAWTPAASLALAGWTLRPRERKRRF